MRGESDESTLYPVKNTFIHVTDGASDQPDEDGALARTKSDPTGRYPAVQKPTWREHVPATVQEEQPEDIVAVKPTHPAGELSDEDDDEGTLQRTTAHIPGAPAFLPLSKHLTGTSSAARDSAGDPSAVWHVKNTFIELEESDLLRTGSNVPPARSESDPTGRSINRPSGLGRTTSKQPAISPVQEDAAEDGAASEDEELERVSTYDPFSGQSVPYNFQPPLMPPLFPLGVPPFSPPSMLDPALPIQASWNPPPIGPSHGWSSQLPTASRARSASVEIAADVPPVGTLHRFHKESTGFGTVSEDFRVFTKSHTYEGRLSVLSESEVHRGGIHRYLVQFTSGELTKADGVGFVFAPRLPCTKNVQKIVSVFVNQSGRICMRVFGEIIKAQAHVTALELGDWIEVAVDLNNSVATFNIWPPDPLAFWVPQSQPCSSAVFHYGKKLAQANRAATNPVKLDMGHFACVVQNVGVTVTIGS
mmetsp:Transcript_31257/g.57188  ORF Transcript_31257/g.57188 Transcript_31257/m.57188 type:complete len:476 (-) Transcript_31257:71-1498(-)